MSDLARMLKAQLELQVEAYGFDLTLLSPEALDRFITWNTLAAQAELIEALEETSWKPWTSRAGEVDYDRFLSEIVDMWHFVMNLLLAVGQGRRPEQIADDFYTRYFEKRQVNVERQRAGYDGRTGKCPQCRRDLEEDPPVTAQNGDVFCKCGRILEWGGAPV